MLHSKFSLSTYLNIFTAFVCVFSFFFIFETAHAAQLFVNPLEPTVEVGDIVKFRVGVNSEGVSINNSESRITFPTDLIQVIGVDTSSSIFNLWVEQPTFSNTNGTISFNGGITNPGYIGANGTLFWITARALKSGNAQINLESSFVRANDGLGTNVLNSSRNTSVAIVEAPPVTPPVVPTPPIDDETDQEEIGEAAPEEDIISPEELFITVTKDDFGAVVVTLEAFDNIAIEYFSVLLDDRNPVRLEAINGKATFVLPKDLKDGSYTLIVTAFDEAGNSITKSEVIYIKRQALEITNYPRELVVGHEARISGISATPQDEVVLVVVYPSRRIETYLVETDEYGVFDFKTEALDQIGEYILWIQKYDVLGVDLSASERVTISVSQTWFQDQVQLVKPYMPIILGCIALFFIFIFVMRIAGFRVMRVKKI